MFSFPSRKLELIINFRLEWNDDLNDIFSYAAYFFGYLIQNNFFKFISVQILVTLLIGSAFAAPPQQQQRQLRQSEYQQPTTEPIPIISQEQEVNYDGTYKWAYETG